MKNTKAIYLPLDERPCNNRFPGLLYKGTPLDIITPEQLGDKKAPADTDALAAFLESACAQAPYAVLAIDTLLYGGLIPSRLHHRAEEEIDARLALLRRIKKANPQLKIFAFQCIMRCPRY